MEVLEAVLQLDINSFTASLQAAAQTVQSFAQAISGSLGTSAQAFQQQVQQINHVVAATEKAAETKKDITKDESDFQKYIDDLRLENWKRHQVFKAQLAKEDAATAKQAAQDNAAQEKATGEFILKQYAEAAAFKLETQKQFFATSMGLAKEREMDEQRSLQAMQAFQQAFFKNTLDMARAHKIAETQLYKDFFVVTMGLEKERLGQEAATVKAMEALQKNFFMVTMGLEKERVAQVAITLKAQEDLQRNFFAVTVGMAKAQNEALVSLQKNFLTITAGFLKERIDDERRAAAQILATWMKAGAQLEQMEVTQTSREEARFRARIARSNASAASGISPFGQGLGGPGVANITQDLLLLQGYINLAQVASKEMGFFGASIARVGTSLRTLGGYFAASFIIGIPFAIAAWAKEAVNTAMKMEDLRLAFTAILGSTKAATETLQDLFRIAQRGGVVFTEIADGFRRMAAAAKNTSLEGEGIRKAFENVVIGARVMGISSAETGRALVAMEQMLTKGRLSAEEYRRQLGNAIPGALELMSRGLGVTTQSLERMIESGLIPADAAVVALGKSMGALATNSTVDTLDRLSATFARLKNEGTAWMTELGGWIGDKLKPFLDITVKISAALREMLSIGPPGTSPSGTAGSPIATTSPYDEAIKRHALQAGIDAEVFRSLIGAESGFRANILGPLITAGAAKGERAVGLGQLLPSTASMYGPGTEAYLMDPENNLRVSARYFADLMRELGKDFGALDDKVKLTAAAYNAGIGHVEEALRTLQKEGKALTAANVVPLLPQPGQTGPYLNRIFGQGGTAGGPAVTDPMDALVKGVEKTLAELPKIEAEMDRVAKSSLNFGGILGGEVVKQAGKVTDEFVKTAELLAAFPDLYNKLTPAQKEQLDLAAKQVAVMNERVRDEAQRPADAARAIAAMKKLVEAEEKFQADRKTMSEEFRATTLAHEEGSLAAALEKIEQKVQKAREKGVDQIEIERFVAAETTRIYAEQYQKFLEYDKGKFAAIKKRSEDTQALEALITETEAKGTKTRLDDFLAAEDKKRERFKAGTALSDGDLTQENQFEAASAQAYFRLLGEEHDKATKEAEKSWRELSNTIESTLASAFQSIFSGSKNLFEGIRDAFLKLLARLAADALTHAIIIPAIIQVFGGGGGGGVGGVSGGGAGGGTLGAIGGGGGGSGVSGTLGNALGMASAGNAISAALGGPSLSLGSTGLFSSITSTTLSEIPGIAGFVGPESALGATTLGTIGTGVGAGIAVGMVVNKILVEINKMMGLKGTGGSVLAGAGAGAAGGAVAGSIIPVIGTGIGAAVGTALGALGGFLSSTLGKTKQPGFDITSIQAGQIGYDDVVGLRVEQNFKILDDFHQKLGTDYEDFIAKMDDSFNQMFETVVSQVSGASPEVQKALVEPLNSAFNEIAMLIREYPEIGGEDFQKQLEQMMQDFGKAFADTSEAAIGKLMDAVAKIDPIVKAFTQIIDHLLGQIKELQQQQKALDTTLAGNITSLEESLMNPAQILLRRKQEMAGLVSQFEGGDEMTRILLAPKIGELANTILELSKAVLSPQISFGDLTGIQAAIKQISEATYTPAQTLSARQGDLADLMAQFRSGNDAIRAGLTPQITQLALQIMELAQGVEDFADEQAEQRKTLMTDFPSQLRAITNALYSPAQNYLSGQAQLGGLLEQFYRGDTAEQLTLEPQIAALAAELLNLASSVEVLGQDPQLLRRTQADLLAVVQGVQNTIAAQQHTQMSDAALLRDTVSRTQAEVIGVLREVEYITAGSIANAGQQTIQALWATAGQIIGVTYTMSGGIITAEYQTANGMITAQYTAAGQLMGTEHYIGGVLQASINNTSSTVGAWSNALYQQQNYLIGVVSHARDIAWVSYTNLIGALWTEIALAQEEIRLLVNALYHLETVDAVVARALGVLGDMNARLGNPLNVRLDQGIGVQLQQDTLTTTQNLLRQQQNANKAIIALLSKSAFGLSFEQGLDLGGSFTGYQHGGRVPFSMMAYLHQGERVIPEWENRGGGRNITIQVYGGSKDPEQIADAVIRKIETKSGRLHSTTIQTSRR